MSKLDHIPAKSVDFGNRVRDDYGDIEEMKDSFLENGIITPITVVDKDHTSAETLKRMGETEEHCQYLLIAGGRRLKAALDLYSRGNDDFHAVPAQILNEEQDAYELRKKELEENVKRKNLSYAEKAMATKALHDLEVEKHGEKRSRKPDASGHSLRDTAKMVGKSAGSVSEDVQLAEMIERVPELGQLKNKTEAKKLLKKIQKRHELSENRKKLEEERAQTPIDRQRKQLAERYIVRDFFQGIQEVPDKSITFADIDPPWAMDYNENRLADDKSDMTDYADVEHKDFPQFMQDTYKALYPKMAEHSWLIVWFAPDPWFHDIYDWAEEAGFEARRTPMIWYKGVKGQSRRPEYHPGSSYEMIAYMKKGRPTLMEPGFDNVLTQKKVFAGRKKHPNEKPIELYQRLLECFCHEGSNIISPFLGGGNILLAAANLGFESFGYDLGDSYKDAFISEVYKGVPGGYTSFPGKEKK